MIVTKTGFAELTGYTPRQVGKWLSDGMPAEDAGGRRGAPRKIDTAKAIRWLLVRAGGNLQPSTLQAARRGLIDAQADKARLEARRMAGDLLERESVEVVINEAASTLVRGLASLPGRMVAALSGPSSAAQIHHATAREVNSLRTELADQFAALVAIADGGPDPREPHKKITRRGTKARKKK